MKDKLKIYLSKDVVEEIATFRDEYPNFYKILKEASILVIDMTEEELYNSLSDINSTFSMFCNLNNIVTKAKSNQYATLYSSFEEILKRPRSMFFFDITTEQAKICSEKLGVLVLSSGSFEDSIFNRNVFSNKFIKGQKYSELDFKDAWKHSFNGIDLLPFNAIVLTDNYLLQNTTLGKANLVALLDVILPQKLAFSFHVLICTERPQISQKLLQQIVGQILAEVRTLRKYEIQMEFIFSETIHPRRIYTNYNTFFLDKGFVLFKRKNSSMVAVDDNEAIVKTAFQNFVYSSGVSLYRLASIDLEKILDKAKIVKEQIANVPNCDKFIMGDCLKDKTIINRLINSN